LCYCPLTESYSLINFNTVILTFFLEREPNHNDGDDTVVKNIDDDDSVLAALANSVHHAPSDAAAANAAVDDMD
jgi:hypothetical protein